MGEIPNKRRILGRQILLRSVATGAHMLERISQVSVGISMPQMLRSSGLCAQDE